MPKNDRRSIREVEIRKINTPAHDQTFEEVFRVHSEPVDSIHPDHSEHEHDDSDTEGTEDQGGQQHSHQHSHGGYGGHGHSGGFRVPPRVIMWLSVVVSLILLFIASGVIFTGAKLTVTEKTREVNIDSDITIDKTEDGLVIFDTIELTETATSSVKTTGNVKVYKKATGNITIENSTISSQKLVKTTRFQSPSGLIYRILSSVTVPGKSASTGMPGSIVVKAEADQSGPKYNFSGETKFTIPGLKTNLEKFSLITGSSLKMSGGMESVGAISATDIKTATDLIEPLLKNKVENRLRSSVPAKFIAYDGLYDITLSDTNGPEIQDFDDISKVLVFKASGKVVIFDRKNFAKFLGRYALKSEKVNDLDIEDISTLSVSYTFSSIDDRESMSKDSVRIHVKGPIKIIYKYNEEKLKQALVGKPSADMAKILANFPEIEKAKVVIRPIWNKKFPDKIEKITIINNDI